MTEIGARFHRERDVVFGTGAVDGATDECAALADAYLATVGSLHDAVALCGVAQLRRGIAEVAVSPGVYFEDDSMVTRMVLLSAQLQKFSSMRDIVVFAFERDEAQVDAKA